MAMIRAVCLALALAAGCARPAPVETPAPRQPEASPVASIVASNPEVSVDSSSDLAVRVFERAVAPDIPALPPVERFARAPRPRTASLDPGEIVVAPTMKLPPSPARPVEAVGLRPAPPVERVPPDLGAGAAAVPEKPKLPITAAPVKRSRDANLPPPLPTLGRPASDRTGFDDPTTDIAASAITGPPVNAPFARAPFLKLGIPDPFELGEQIRPAIPPAAEPGLPLVPVNPRRVK